MPAYIILLIPLAFAIACAKPTVVSNDLPVDFDTDLPIALTDELRFTYKGYERGLYPGLSNQIPSKHAELGDYMAGLIRPLDVLGEPSQTGSIVLLSIGSGAARQIFCNPFEFNESVCREGSFVYKARQQINLNPAVYFVNGAQNGASAISWISDATPPFDYIENTLLQPAGLSEAQVQVVWLNVANAIPSQSPLLPSAQSDAIRLLEHLSNIVRSIITRYPNVKQVFISSDIYAGYAASASNTREPYAYETGFSVKWLLESQLIQLSTGVVNPVTGSLALGPAPWLGWGPYMWAPGNTTRSDGLVWNRSDFLTDGTSLSLSGMNKASDLLVDFFTKDERTKCWFLVGEWCP